MIKTAARSEIRAPLWQRLILHPLAWGVLLLAGAIAATLAGDDLSFFPFLLMLVGGWCFGFAFVNATMRLVPARNGALLHILVAVLLAAVLVVFVAEAGGDLLRPFPEPVRGIAVVLQLAAIPATVWIWLGLLARVSDVFTRRDAKKRPPSTPEWERDESGDGSRIRFPGIPLRLRVITRAIIVIVAIVGLFAMFLLIALDDIAMRLGAQTVIILVGVLIALPAYLMFTAVLRRRTASCVVAFGNDELRLHVGDETQVIRFRDLELLLWRSRSDYARIEVRGAGVDVSLIVGLAKPPAGRTAELPALPRRVFRRLELEGLMLERSRRDDVITFRRP